MLKTTVSDIRTLNGGEIMKVNQVLDTESEDFSDIDKNFEPISKKPRSEYVWQTECTSKNSRSVPVFPEQNFERFKNLSPRELFGMIIHQEVLSYIAEKSNNYGVKKMGSPPNITENDIKIFFGILLLSGYNSPTNYTLMWSNSPNTENQLVKNAMSRDCFKLVKKCFHLGAQGPEMPSGLTDKYGKVGYLIQVLQKKYSELYVPEQNLSHDEAMIAYFGKNSLKQAIRNKPIRFGYKAWCLTTVSGYLVTFDLYQGVGVGTNHQANVVNVGASGASVLDLLDILPEDKRRLSYHIFGDNYFSSLKLVDSLVERNYNYTGRIRSDRLKGKPNLTSSDQFKKKTEDPVKLSVCKMIVKPLSDGMIMPQLPS